LKNALIVNTHWSYDKKAKIKRNRDGVSEETVSKDLNEKIKNCITDGNGATIDFPELKHIFIDNDALNYPGDDEYIEVDK
jgi:hypothetical protein